MSEATDEHFLRAWAEKADESAFRSLVGRYAGFIHGAALRRTRDAGLAEEITQDVFARLAQKAARLAGHPALSGWLHRPAMLFARDRLRRRARHEKRLEEFSTMTPDDAPNPLDAAIPHLDAALDTLSAPDREVLFLHYMQKQTFPQIATRLGGTADAVRMRANRALSALSDLLRKKGVSLSVATLSASLGSTLAQAAPATLVILPAALAGAGKVSALSIIIHAVQTMKLAKATALTALALVLAAPLIFQQQQIAAAEGRIAALTRSRAEEVDLAKDAKSSAATVSTRTGGKSVRRLDLKRLAEDALQANHFARFEVHRQIAGLDTNNLVGLIETVLNGGLLPGARNKLIIHLLDELKQRDAGLHVKWSFTALSPNAVFHQDSGTDPRICWPMEDSFMRWILENPAEADVWATANREEWNRRRCVRMELLEATSLFASEPERAFKAMENLTMEECLTVLSKSDGVFPAEQYLPLAHWAASIGDVAKRRKLVAEALRKRWSADGGRKSKFMESSEKMLLGLGLNEDDLTAVATQIAENRHSAKGLREQSFLWLEKILPANRAAYAKGALVGRLLLSRELHAILSDELDKNHHDELVAGFVETLSPGGSATIVGDPANCEVAFQVALRVKEPALRIELLSVAWTIFQKVAPEKATSILNSAKLSAEDIRAIRTSAETQTLDKP